jgi:tRNA(Ile)-lysidine synthase
LCRYHGGKETVGFQNYDAMNLYQRFKTFVDEEHLLPERQPVLAAVSGGIDSMTLLHLLVRLRGERPFRFGVAHVHHGLRGAAADADAEFVRQAAESVGVPFYLERVDTSAAAKGGVSIEQAARELRYRALERFRKEGGYSCIAVAHTADDQAETVLLNFLRGAGVRGLAGMPPKRGTIVRPLLFASRTEILEYAQDHGVEYRHDATNDDLRFRRNRLRHELLPYLVKHFNPDVAQLLSRNARLFREYEEDLEHRAAKVLKQVTLARDKDKIVLDIHSLLGYFTLLRAYAIYLILDDLNLGRGSLTGSQTAALLSLIERQAIGKRFPLSKGWEVLIDRGAVVFHRPSVNNSETAVPVGQEVPIPGFGVTFKSRLLPHPPAAIPVHSNNIEVVDFDAVGEELRIRSFRAGDRFWPLKASGFKKVGDFLTDRKVPLHLRSRIPILESNRGIVWVCGYRLDHRFRLTEHTRRVLQIEISHD